MVDGHRHYQTGAGWTEHSVFIAETIDAKGFLTPIPQGPRSKTDRKKAGRKCKRSARTKAMLAAPGRPAEATATSSATPAQPVGWDVESFLPGLPTDNAKLPVLSCVGARGDARSFGESCMAATKTGARCCRKRVSGNFCQQHFNEVASQNVREAFWGDIEDMFDDARSQWEREQVNLAVKLSIEEDQEQAEARARSARTVERRLLTQGLRRIPTPAEGDCMFCAVAFSAEIPIDIYALRQQTVAYLGSFPQFFGSYFDNRWASFEMYLLHLSRPGSWGDDLCLIAMAHLLLRPIHVVTDHIDENQGILILEPPAQIAKETWGEPIWIAYLGWKHYEATEEIPAAQVSVKTKS